jgi:transglutaminase-like putative cysteine protease
MTPLRWSPLAAALLALWLGLATGCTGIQVETPAQASLDQALDMDTRQAEPGEAHWYAIYCEGRKIGWRHVNESRLRRNGRTFQLHTQTTYEKYFRYGQAVEKKEVVKTVHDQRNQFVRAAISLQEGNQTSSRADIKDYGAGLEVKLVRGETKKSLTLRCQVTNLYPLTKQIQTMEMAEGVENRIQLFDPDNLRIDTYTAKVISRVGLDLGNGPQTAWYVSLQNKGRHLQDIYLNADDPTRVLKIVHHDTPYTYVRMAERKARSDLERYDFNETHDIKSESQVSASWGVHSAVLDITNEALSQLLVQDAWQSRLKELDGAGTRWMFRARDVDDKLADRLPLDLNEADPFLGATFYIQSDHPKIREIATRIADSETNALRLFRKFAMWVFNNIKDKNYKTGLATAVETLGKKEGDCTEHAVLTVALARAAGIPSRIAVGLYYDRESASFTYHMWVEALVAEGLWAAVDPAMGQIEPDALHLTVYQGDLDIGTHTSVTWGLVQSLKPGDLKIIAINQNSSE